MYDLGFKKKMNLIFDSRYWTENKSKFKSGSLFLSIYLFIFDTFYLHVA